MVRVLTSRTTRNHREVNQRIAGRWMAFSVSDVFEIALQYISEPRSDLDVRFAATYTLGV